MPVWPIDEFLDGAQAVAAAVSSPLLPGAWNAPSVLEGQLVSSLVGHLARGGVWVVQDYLTDEPPAGPVDFEDAADYITSFVNAATGEAHQAIRERGAAVGSAGPEEVAREVASRLAAIEPALRNLEPDRLVSVIGGRTMRLGDYLVTRIVEQAVHLDDLARSLEVEPFAYPESAEDLAIATALDILRLRHPRRTVLRSLYRREGAQVLPVL